MNDISEEDIKKMNANQETVIRMLDGLIKILEDENKKVIE